MANITRGPGVSELTGEAPLFNAQTVKAVQECRQQLPGWVQQENVFSDVMRNLKAQAIDGANAPTQAEIDEVNRQGGAMYGGSSYVPLTLEAWTALMSAMTAMFDGWNGGQNTAFLNAKP
jgi:hypothetical protein